MTFLLGRERAHGAALGKPRTPSSRAYLVSRHNGFRYLSHRAARLRTDFFACGFGLQHVAGSGIQCLRAFLADSRHRFISDDLSCEDRVLRTDLMSGANQVTDHNLVALARKHGFALATFDESLASTFGQEPDLVRLVR